MNLDKMAEAMGLAGGLYVVAPIVGLLTCGRAVAPKLKMVKKGPLVDAGSKAKNMPHALQKLLVRHGGDGVVWRLVCSLLNMVRRWARARRQRVCDRCYAHGAADSIAAAVVDGDRRKLTRQVRSGAVAGAEEHNGG